MSETMVGLIGIIVLVISILSGIHIFLALGLVGTIGIIVGGGAGAAFSVLRTTFFTFTHSYHFSCIPMFILMGNFALSAGIGQDTFNAPSKWLGRTKGGLAHATVLAAALFGAAPGSSVGSAALFSRLALPEMVKHGYDKSLASACVAIAGTLAVMIPPSALMIVYAILKVCGTPDHLDWQHHRRPLRGVIYPDRGWGPGSAVYPDHRRDQAERFSRAHVCTP